METIHTLLDFVLHIDQHLPAMIAQYGTYIYAVLFLIIFSETGFVVTPFLPGDSLLFAVGMIAGNAANHLSYTMAVVVLSVAAVTGNIINYHIGKFIGPRVFNMNIRFLKKEYLTRTQSFYDKYGGLTIVISRFMPIIRTFAPFVAGIGSMNYIKFMLFNFIGGTVWVIAFISAGFFLGKFEWVQQHFEFIALAIITASLLPVIMGLLFKKKKV